MPRTIISTPDAPSSPLYAQGVEAGGQVFISGTVGIDPATGGIAGETIQEQTRQALKNCEAILKAGAATLDDVVEVGVLLHDPMTSRASTRSGSAGFLPTPRRATRRSSAP